MTDKVYNKWSEKSDGFLLAQMGAFIKHHRINQNVTQAELSKAAGMSRSTLSAMESGATVTTETLVRLLRVLDKLEVLQAFEVEKTISPIALAKQQRKERQRARPKKNTEKDSTVDW